MFLINHFRSIIILLLFIVLGGGWFFFSEPKLEALKAEKINFKKQQESLTFKENYLEELKKITRDYEKITQEKIKKINSVLPSEADLPGIFVQMDALAKENGFVLRSIEAIQSKAKKGSEPLDSTQDRLLDGSRKQEEESSKKRKSIKEISITLELENGSYEKIKKFLDGVEKNLRILDIVSINFDSGGSSFKVNLKTYYL